MWVGTMQTTARPSSHTSASGREDRGGGVANRGPDMPLCLWLVFEDPVITRIKSENLARAQNMGKLDEAALAQDVLRLENFCSPSVEEILRSLVGEDEPTPARWFDPRDGLESFRGILTHGEQHPGLIRGMTRDLRAFEKALSEGVKRKIRFRLQLDYRDFI